MCFSCVVMPLVERFNCEKCSKSYVSKQSLKRHSNKHHNSTFCNTLDGIIKCNNCGKEFSDFLEFNTHLGDNINITPNMEGVTAAAAIDVSGDQTSESTSTSNIPAATATGYPYPSAASTSQFCDLDDYFVARPYSPISDCEGVVLPATSATLKRKREESNCCCEKMESLAKKVDSLEQRIHAFEAIIVKEFPVTISSAMGELIGNQSEFHRKLYGILQKEIRSVKDLCQPKPKDVVPDDLIRSITDLNTAVLSIVKT